MHEADMRRPLDGLAALTRFAVGNLTPDLTIVLDLPAEAGLARAGRRMAAGPETETRFEGRDLRFHEAVRDGFLDIARKEPARCVVVDAAVPVDDVARRIAAAVGERLFADG